MSKRERVVGQFKFGNLIVDRVEITPCYRASAIGKGIPQYCTCVDCTPRGDLGKILVPVVVDGQWLVVEKQN